MLAAVATALASSLFAQAVGSIGGTVTDSLGAIVVGATVTAVSAAGQQKQSITNARGEYSIPALAPGKYTVKAIAPKFALYENTEVDVASGERNELSVVLTVAGVQENVDVGVANQIDNDPANNASATIIKEKDLEALPDDPDELAAALQALAGSASGPDGGQINIDGFTGGRMPPKEAIREIRINQNPFSAEYDRIGFGRIDILTKPGFDKFRGSVDFRFNDESLNSRNPFARNRAPSQTRNFGGFLSGPIQSKKSSFFVDFNQSSNDQNAVIAADILDSSGNFARFDQDIRVPNRRFSISPRLDYALNDNNTLVARYSFTRNTSENQGIGGFTLPTRATESTSTSHEIRLTESMIINPKTVNETRFSYEYNNRETIGTAGAAGINVSGAFFGGGAQTGDNYNISKRWELNNATTTSLGKNSQHAIKFGIRVRGVTIDDRSENNYGGTFTFTGFAAPGGDPCDINGDLFVSSLEQYRCKVQGRTETRYNPNQFTITAGNPLAGVSQVDYSPYITDDWKVRPDLTLSFGLRYENQTNLKSNLNFAPRFGFAWSPGAGGAKAPKTVFRGGAGVFYDRFSESQTLRANRQDGVSQLSYLVTDNPAILGQAVFTPTGVTNVPTAAQVAAAIPRSSIPYRLASDLSAPYSIQAALSVERQITAKTVFSATYALARSLHTLRTRNINAPVCPNTTVCPVTPTRLTDTQIAALRPDPTQGNIYQVESTGYADSKMLMLNMRTTIGSKINLNAGYTLGFANGDTDSLSSPRFQVNTVGFPAYSYDTSNEYAPSAFIARHQLFFFGSFQLPWGIRANPMVIASTGRRFNITTGIDTNYDSLYFERPTFAALSTRCQELRLTNSFCNMSGVTDMNAVIPRNYGKGPGSFVTNLNLSKTFGFGGGDAAVTGGTTGGGGRGGRGGNRGGGGGGRGAIAGGGPMMGMMGGGGGDTRKPYQLTVGINVQNLFNTVNFSNPVSTLSSPSFGQYRSTGGGFGFFGGGGGSANRRVDLSLRFTF